MPDSLSRILPIGSVLFVLVVLLHFASLQSAPICDSSLFRSLTPLDFNASGTLLLYSQRNRPCNVDVYSTAYLDCGPVQESPTYTSYSIALASSGTVAGSSGLCAYYAISQVAPVTIGCRQYYPPNTPPSQPYSLLLKQIFVGVAITRTVLYYPQEALSRYTFPFLFAQYGGPGDPSGFCDPNAAQCGAPTLARATLGATQACDASYRATTWLDFPGLPQQTSSFSDPISTDNSAFPTVDNDQCQYVCCPACGTSNQSSSWRRWPVGPICQAFRYGAPQLRLYGAVIVSFNADLSGNDNDVILFQHATVSSDGQVTYGQGLGQTRDFISNSRKVRFTLNALAQGALPPDLQQLPGYGIRCFYGPQTSIATTCDLGISNPYASKKVPPPCIAKYNATLAALLPPVVPDSAGPTEVGAGYVPTITSLGNKSQCSFFFVPNSLINAVVAPNDAIGSNPVSQQVGFMWNNLNPLDGSNVCPGGNGTDYFGTYVNVPGLQLNSSGDPLYVSVSQMSADLNEYAFKFDAQFTENPVDGQAALNAAGAAPPWLYPFWSMLAANWWPHDNGMIFDLGRTFGQQNVGEGLLQLSDDTWLTLEANQFLYQISPTSLCTAYTKQGNGGIEIIVQGLAEVGNGQDYGMSRLLITCQTAQHKPAIIYDMRTNKPLTNNTIAFNIVNGGTDIAAPLNMSFAPARNGTSNPNYVTCQAQLIADDGSFYGPQLNLTCRQLGFKNSSEVHRDDTDNTNVYIALAALLVAVGLFVIILVGVGITVAVKKNAQSMQDAATAKSM